MTYDIKDVEIFAVGRWNGEHFSSRDLVGLVETFAKTKDLLKPYLKLGHADNQTILKNDQLPAAGWVENLRLVGDRLVADFARVPRKIKELIDAGAYRRVSVELFENIKLSSGAYPLALKAVALLGAETPAVETLDDIIALYGADGAAVRAYEADDEVQVKAYRYEKAAPNLNKGESGSMEKELQDLKDKLAASEKRCAQLEAEKKAFAETQAQIGKLEGELKAEKDARAAADKKVGELEASVEKFKTDARTKEHKAKVEELIRNKKLAPAQKDFALALLESVPGDTTKKFSVGGKDYEKPEDLIFAMLESGSAALPEDGKTGAGEANRDGAREGEVGVELDKQAKKYAEEHKVSYREALIRVSREAADKR